MKLKTHSLDLRPKNVKINPFNIKFIENTKKWIIPITIEEMPKKLPFWFYY